jgi:hypothetical protein
MSSSKRKSTAGQRSSSEGAPGGSKKELPAFGQIHYKLDYNFSEKRLSVTVEECRNLPAMDANVS